MTQSDIFPEFERLWASYASYSNAAGHLSSPNAKDDDFIKMAIVGFGSHQKTEEWGAKHWELAKQYLDECAEAEGTEKMKKFSMLALGALLGLKSAGKLDDRLYLIGSMWLPGFVLLKGAAVESL